MPSLRDGQFRSWGRRYLVKLQDGRCCYCRREFTKRGATSPTIEHKKRRADGGSDHIRNLSIACLHCNQHRGQQMNVARSSPARCLNGLGMGAPLATSMALLIAQESVADMLGPCDQDSR